MLTCTNVDSRVIKKIRTVQSMQRSGIMSHQTRIDQFYPSVMSKRTSDVTVVKKQSRSIRSPYTVRGKRGWNDNRNATRSRCSKETDILDCVITYEKINNAEGTSVCKETEIEDIIIEEKMSQDIMSDVNTIEEVLIDDDKCLIKPQEIKKQQREKLKEKIKVSEERWISIDDENTVENSVQINNGLIIQKNSPHNSPVSPSELKNHTNETYPAKSPTTVPRKSLFASIKDTDIMTQTIEHMNLVNRGAIQQHNLDLEEIYSCNNFQYQHGQLSSKGPWKYKLSDINICDDLNAKIFFTTIFSVLSNPVNCGYFDKTEIDFIYSMITLPREPQMLLARMVKRKKGWFRKSNLNYQDISNNLKDAIDILVSRSICTSDIKSEQLTTILNLLQVEEIRQICQRMHVNSRGTKEANIESLLRLSKYKPLFPGMRNSNSSLYSSILDVLDYCVCVTSETWNIIDKIITLLLPTQDVSDSISDKFFLLGEIFLSKTIYPAISGSTFPVFSSKQHLTSYLEAKSILFTILQYIQRKDWEGARVLGNVAMDTLPDLLQAELERLENGNLPLHVRRYMPGYVWLKVLSTSLEAFKKDNNKERVVEVLTFLVTQDCHMHDKKGKWYEELALVEMHHRKNADGSATIVACALNMPRLTRVDKVNLLNRANKILKRRTGVTADTRTIMCKLVQDHNDQASKYKPTNNIIYAKLMSQRATNNKSNWLIESSTESMNYGSVETLALYFYCEQGFAQGWHCEGALPIVLFFTLFWEELYDAHVPGAFVTNYQDAPSDLFTGEFYGNRRDKIDTKLQIVDTLDVETFARIMEEKFQVCKRYCSRMSMCLNNNIHMKEIVECLGVQGITGICTRLLENFKLWKSGFPDLLVWNRNTKAYKIVEVKGPRDKLSTKQLLWLEYLDQLGLDTEVCLVKDKNNSRSWCATEEYSD